MTPVVTVSTGALAGSTLASGVSAFLGVPYAAPPVGPLRFAPPAAPAPWQGTRPAAVHGPAAPQNPAGGGRVLCDLSSPTMDEDCLTLAVWTPSPGPAERLPVLVWFHGGAFVTGSPAVPAYDGARLAERGVVVVGVTYRLGLLGWLRCAELGADGNQGLADQAAALAWVQREIGAFGGDPSNVTVFGESAGAASIAAHLAAGGEPPFRRAVLQSGSYDLILPAARADATTARVLAALDGRPASALRDLPLADVLALQERATPRAAGVFYGPVADGSAVPADPGRALAAGASRVPVLVGTNRDEMGFFWGRDERLDTVDDTLLTTLAGRWRDDPDGLVATYRAARAERGEPTDARSVLIAIGTDATFRIAATALAGWQSRTDARPPAQGPAQAPARPPAPGQDRPQAHVYRFDHASPLYDGLVGAGHVLEVPFVFGTHAHPTVAAFTGAERDRATTDVLSDAMASAWVAFARDGDPGWPAYGPARTTRLFGGPADGTLVDDPAGPERRAWDPHALR